MDTLNPITARKIRGSRIFLLYKCLILMKCCSIIKHFHWSIFNFFRDLWVISLLLVTAKLLQLHYDNDLLSWNQSRICFIFIFFSFEGSKYIIICSPFTSSLLKMGQQKTLTRHISVMKTGSISVSGQLPTYPSPNPTLTLTCYQ